MSETMTAVFNINLRRFDGNPLHTKTPFGKPQQVGIGNEFERGDKLEKKLEEIEAAARRLLNNSEGHYMNAEDMYSLQCALGYFEENPE
jgi:hypothetical protein